MSVCAYMQLTLPSHCLGKENRGPHGQISIQFLLQNMAVKACCFPSLFILLSWCVLGLVKIIYPRGPPSHNKSSLKYVCIYFTILP